MSEAPGRHGRAPETFFFEKVAKNSFNIFDFLNASKRHHHSSFFSYIYASLLCVVLSRENFPKGSGGR